MAKNKKKKDEVQEEAKPVKVKSSFMDFLRERTEKRLQQKIVKK